MTYPSATFDPHCIGTALGEAPAGWGGGVFFRLEWDNPFAWFDDTPFGANISNLGYFSAAFGFTGIDGVFAHAGVMQIMGVSHQLGYPLLHVVDFLLSL